LVTLGEGNFSDGNRNIFMNYSNPGFIDAIGSVYDVVLPRFAHEYVHELFSEVAQSHPGHSLCLNEGLADALAFAAGFLPEQDFGPIGLRGADFNQGCAAIVQDFETHDAGNCPLWQIHRLGLLSPAFAARVLTPQHLISFDSCDLTSPRTGNALLVLFSAAAGRDMTQAIQMATIPNAGSVEAARRALGLIPSEGDLDSDGDVDQEDLVMLLRDRNKSVRASRCGTRCDLNGDGNVTALDARKLADLDLLQAVNFPLATILFDAAALGTSALTFSVNVLGDASGGPLTATLGTGSLRVSDVPEPGTVMLFSTGLLALGSLTYRFRKQVE
jgi:hypothetical protein